ncbi:MAG: alpha/beta hydrolase [Anaerolineales bacterium]
MPSIPANGLIIHYTEHGSGQPLVLLHTGTATGQMWERQLPALQAHFRVIVPDLRAHGGTDNPSGQFTYRLLADDVAALGEALALERPFVAGWGDGGQVALDFGMRYSDQVQALVIGGAWFSFSEAYLDGIHGLGLLGPGQVDPAETERNVPQLVALWREWHPRDEQPDYWQTLLLQISQAWMTPLDYTLEDYHEIRCPALIVIGDRDSMIPVGEALALHQFIRGSELAVVPAGNHSLPVLRPELFASLLLDFLLRHAAPPKEQGA